MFNNFFFCKSTQTNLYESFSNMSSTQELKDSHTLEEEECLYLHSTFLDSYRPTRTHIIYDSYADFCRECKQKGYTTRCINMSIYKLQDINQTAEQVGEYTKRLEDPEFLKNVLIDLQDLLPPDMDYSNLYTVTIEGDMIHEQLNTSDPNLSLLIYTAIQDKFLLFKSQEISTNATYECHLYWDSSSICRSFYQQIMKVTNNPEIKYVVYTMYANDFVLEGSEQEMREIFGNEIYDAGLEEMITICKPPLIKIEKVSASN